MQNHPIISHAPKKPKKIASSLQPTPLLSIDPKLQTQEVPKLEYNVVEDLKRMKANVFFMDLCKIPQQKELLLKALKEHEKPMVEPNPNVGKTTFGETRKSNIKSATTDGKSRLTIPAFLSTFEIYNINLHNCLVDFDASSNIMPYSVCNKLNITPAKIDTHIIKLNKNEVKVIGELKYVMIHIASNRDFHQVIDIIVVDIPEAYKILLS